MMETDRIVLEEEFHLGSAEGRRPQVFSGGSTIRRVLGWGGWVLFGAAALGACASAGKDSPSMPRLYQRLGGSQGIARVVADFTTTMVGDARVNERFKGLKPPEVEKFKSNLADQICEMAGGPCSYSGKDMKSAHKGMKITEAEWTATIENLVKALDKNNVNAQAKQQLLGALGPMAKDIVGQ
jgi:hemoglobin